MVLITRRKQQVGYDGGPCGEQIVGGVVVAETEAGRDAWIGRLSRLHPLRFTYFCCYRDVSGPAVFFGHDLPGRDPDRPYIIR